MVTMFSVIIATRNRPTVFRQALNSALGQSCESVEFIVVNDGSEQEHIQEYQSIISSSRRPVQFHSLVLRPKGHGQSYALNFGVSLARGEYVCFLDDDDYWTDPEYLERAKRTISAFPSADLHMSNQAAFVNDVRQPGPIWIEGLTDHLSRLGREPNGEGVFAVTVQDLLGIDGFCHLNTLIVRRSLYTAIGGMDEGIRWECDHDVYLRLIDLATRILYSPSVVSRHNVPDRAAKQSMTTSLSELDRRLFQLRVFDKAALFAVHEEIRSLGKAYKGYTLKRIAELLAQAKDYESARFYARTALGAAPTIKWAAYTTYLHLFARAVSAPLDSQVR